MPPLSAAAAAAADTLFREQTFLGRIAPVPVGGQVSVAGQTARAREILENTGFIHLEGDRFIREVALDAEVGPLETFTSEAVTGFDAVVMLSIHRQKEGEDYVLATLESTLRALPAEVVVNVAIGDDLDAYLSQDILVETLGADDAGRLRLHPTSPRDAHFLLEHMDIKHRAAWNVARVLRSYHGVRGLLVLEDDILWSSRATSYLERWLGGSRPDFVSLYTRMGYLRPATSRWGELMIYPQGGVFPRFECTQAIYIGPHLARQLGDFLLMNLQQTSYDWNISEFLRRFGVPMGYALPSIVQHVGFRSSGLGVFHQSDCFAP